MLALIIGLGGGGKANYASGGNAKALRGCFLYLNLNFYTHETQKQANTTGV